MNNSNNINENNYSRYESSVAPQDRSEENTLTNFFQGALRRIQSIPKPITTDLPSRKRTYSPQINRVTPITPCYSTTSSSDVTRSLVRVISNSSMDKEEEAPQMRSSKWTPEEDDLLRNSIQVFRNNHQGIPFWENPLSESMTRAAWKEIAATYNESANYPERNFKAIERRWMFFVSPLAIQSHICPNRPESDKILEIYYRVGKHYEDIAKEFCEQHPEHKYFSSKKIQDFIAKQPHTIQAHDDSWEKDFLDYWDHRPLTPLPQKKRRNEHI